MTINESFSEPLSILILDADQNSRQDLSIILQSRNHAVLTTDNLQKAQQLLSTAHVDIVIADPLLADVGNLAWIDRLLADISPPLPAVIAISDNEQEDRIMSTLTAGADDFLIKPVSEALLHSKIRLLYEMRQLQHKSWKYHHRLQSLQIESDNQQALAKRLFDQILYEDTLDDHRLDYWLSPSERFSGDLITAAKMDNDRLCVLLADSAGHGLSAALPTLIIARTFDAMTAKGFTLSTITREINRSLHGLLTAEYFVASILCLFDFRHQTIECWNGGMPTAFFISHAGRPMHEFESQHMPLGILPESQFNSATSLYHWHDLGEMVFFSDGLAEAENPQGEAFGYPQVLSIVNGRIRKGQSRVAMIKEAVIKHMKDEQGHDDISLLAVQCG